MLRYPILNGVVKLFIKFVILVVVRELKHLFLLDSVDVLKFSLPVPVFIEQVVVGLQFLSDFANQVEVLFGLISGDAELRVELILDLHPKQSFPLHKLHDEPQVEAPNPDYDEHNQERYEYVSAIHLISFFILLLVELKFLLCVVLESLALQKLLVDLFPLKISFQKVVDFVDPVNNRCVSEQHEKQSDKTSEVLCR